MNNSKIIGSRIIEIRGKKVMLDLDLADLYLVPRKALNQAYKRNMERFPLDFAFQLSENEWENLRSQFVTAKTSKSRYLPTAYTEHGILMLANILQSPTAIQASIAIIRIFNEIKHQVFDVSNLVRRLSLVEAAVINNCTDMVEIKNKLRELIDTVNELVLKTPSLPNDRKQIGIHTPDKKTSS